MEILGAVGASVQLVQVAGTCLSIVQEVRSISLVARDQNAAHFELLVQALKFEKWCAALGIQGMLKNAKQGQDACRHSMEDRQTRLGETIRSQLRLENPKLEQLTLEALKDMREKFAETTKIIAQYAGASTPAETPTNVSSISLQVPRSKKTSVISKLLRKEPRPSPSSTDASSVLSAQSQPNAKGGPNVLMRTKWVTSDKSRVEDLLKSIERTNNLLVVLLDPEHQAHIDRQTDMTILDLVDRDTLEATTTRPDLKAMGRIKRWQKQEQSDNGDEDLASTYSSTTISSPAPTRVRTYQVRDFKRESLPHGEYRTLTSLEDKRVMVEWKYYNQDQPIRLERTMRLGGLVGLLNRNEVFQKFMTLPCRGLVSDSINSRIGLVFSVEDPGTSRLKSLYDWIRNTPTPAPLGQRFQLAKSLVTAIHHLHSVDWLHKSIRSENIVCSWAHESTSKLNYSSSTDKSAAVQNSSRDEQDDGPGAASARETRIEALPPFHLVGWDLSRPDHPLELSETLSVSTAGFQNKRDAILLYSHPEMHAQSKPGKRPRYRAQFDIYSLGLVLLEIGLWRTIGELRRHCKDDVEFRVKLGTEYCDKLLPKVGEVYWRVVQRCLRNEFGEPSDRNDESEECFSLQVAFEKFVVSKLEKCFA
ncbi:hypothetical protein INS49_003377 [Diaporthe citri]|uniref:uncharacterized protein n=1 Tax=Diaporthe citri TaxID=83186 RepID=UPI001C81B417|nr:uncharacterized protein INS49_003377 [Diaporthe citri]KAG6355415.1 hypothetical protein INS49_003377 [Diaporthe citri]